MPLAHSAATRPTTTIYRVCYAGVLALSEAQARLGLSRTALEVRPAKCLAPGGTTSELVDATEVLFLDAPYGGGLV